MSQATQRRVAIFSRDPDVRVALARAFDAAPASWEVTLHEVLPVDADVTIAGADIADEELEQAPRSLIRVGSDPEEVIEVVRASLAQPRAVVVTSAVGGCGVTTIALQLALRAGSDALYVEVDAGPTSITAERLDLDRIGPLPRPTRWGFSASSVDSASCDVRTTITGWLAASPVVVIDLGRSGSHRPLWDVPWIFVLPPTKLAAAATGIALQRHHGRCAVVTNRTGPGGEATRMELQASLGCRIALELPLCPALRDLEDGGELALPAWSRWGRRVRRLMRVVEG